MNRRTLRQVLECGNGACDIAAFGLKRALTDWIALVKRADTKAVKSLRSSPHGSKTLARGTPVQSSPVRHFRKQEAQSIERRSRNSFTTE